MAVLAKLSRPRLVGVHPRERLFARLDDCRLRAAAVWISGPPGAGKTTLAASYLDAREAQVLWYQVDAGDADPASFFYHLGLGAQPLCRKAHLPLLTPEYLPDLAGFTRRYFRALCELLPRPCVLVLDNLQDSAEHTPIHAVLRDALAEFPPGIQALLISRTPPPAEHARAQASRALLQLGWDELRLTGAEAAGIVAQTRPLDAAAVGALVERCGGWAAGLTLLLDHAGATGSLADAPTTQAALFDYFATELFDRLPVATRQLLLRTALLPWVGVDMAVALSGNPDAEALLEDLHRRHLFTDRRAGAPASYRYHALFCEFLQERLARQASVEERAALADASARLLAQAGEAAAAVQLHLAASNPDAAVRVVLEQAPRLAAQGRLQTLAGWIQALPAGTTRRLPWLGHWLGLCQLGADPPAARAELEASFEQFTASGDVLGQVLTAAHIIETFNVAFADFRPVDRWIPVLYGLLERSPGTLDAGLELRVRASLLGALAMRGSDRTMLSTCAGRVRDLLDEVPDINSRLLGATRLLQYHVFFDEPPAAQRLVDRIHPQLADPTLSALNHCTWLHMESLCFTWGSFDPPRARQSLDEAFALMEQHGLHFYANLFHATAAVLCLQRADVSGAAVHLARAVPNPDAARFDLGWCDGARSWMALLQQDAPTAVQSAQRLVDVSDAVGAVHPHGMALLWQANARAAAGQHAAALECAAAARRCDVGRLAIGSFSIDLVEADVRLQCGDAGRAQALLRLALATGRQHRLHNTLQWLAPQMSRLCAGALEHGIEPGYVHALIRLRQLRPPSVDCAGWPWPIKVHTLGCFQIRHDDQVLRFEGKAQRKPLTLLKALIAWGGADVPETRLIDSVWDESLAGGRQKTFDVTLHRLRKLLGHDGAIRVSDRRVSLDPESVWVDAWALDRQLAAVVPTAPDRVPEPAELERAAPSILALYRGPFLDGELDAPWLLPVRNRLTGRFLRFVMRLGEQREAARDWAGAAQLYERTLELDPLAESFYGRLMVCLREQDRRAEAIEVFRRCRRMLSVTLGVAPAPDTEALYRGLFPD